MPLHSLINRNKLASSGCLLRFGVCFLISTTPTTHNSPNCPNSPAPATLFIFHGWQCFCQGIRQTFNLHTHTNTHTHSLNLTATMFQHRKLQRRKDEVRRPCKDLAGGTHCTGEWGRESFVKIMLLVWRSNQAKPGTEDDYEISLYDVLADCLPA